MQRVTSINQVNLWGKATDAGGLEPQRSDLWLANFEDALKGVDIWYHKFVPEAKACPPFFPQLVSTASIPAYTIKPEVVRRSSIPFNMPGWDEPLDVVKITFLLEQNQSGLPTALDFLNRWMALVRVGRGTRVTAGAGRNQPFRAFPPGEGNTATIQNFRFDFEIKLLRGGFPSAAVIAPSEIVLANRRALEARAQQVSLQDRLKTSFSQPFLQATSPISFTSVGATGSSLNCLYYSTVFRVLQAWLASFKVSDLTYGNAQFVSVEAAFYPESISVVDSDYEGVTM